jgi:hypothetical protein
MWYKGQESFWATPAPDGIRLYVRGFDYLYCIGEK